MRAVTFLITLLVCCGCAAVSVRPEVDVEVVNLSSRDLSKTEVQFGHHVCSWGTAVRTAAAIYLFYPHPITSTATVRWWEKDHGQMLETLNLRETYPNGAAGRLTFTISDEGVTASFRKK